MEELLGVSKPSEALRLLETQNYKMGLWQQYATCALLSGRADLAYQMLPSAIKRQSPGNEVGQLKYIAACAELGRVEPGQLEFAEAQLQIHSPGYVPGCPRQPFVGHSKLEQTKLTCYLTLACWENLPAKTLYMERIAQVAPEVVFADRAAVRFFEWQGKYKRLRAFVARVAPHVKSVEDRGFLLAAAKRVASMPDKVKREPAIGP